MEPILNVVAWILVVAGAIFTFLVKPVLKKIYGEEADIKKKIYVFKIIGMWLVIIGAVMIFWLGGSFGVRQYQ